jgi:hypothetical protein
MEWRGDDIQPEEAERNLGRKLLDVLFPVFFLQSLSFLVLACRDGIASLLISQSCIFAVVLLGFVFYLRRNRDPELTFFFLLTLHLPAFAFRSWSLALHPEASGFHGNLVAVNLVANALKFTGPVAA